MAISKIILNGVTQMDLTGDTVVADKLMSSYTAHGADGEPITGTSTAIIPTGTKSITENGTGIDVTQYASVDVAVPTSGGGAKVATGKYTPPQTYDTAGNREICTLANIGFTPSRFILELNDKDNTAQTQYMVIRASYELLGDGKAPFRITSRYSNSSGTIGAAHNTASWTTQTNYYLYTNGTTVYFRTTNTYILPQGVTYKWTAYE